jgi:hypothetical protein
MTKATSTRPVARKASTRAGAIRPRLACKAKTVRRAACAAFREPLFAPPARPRLGCFSLDGDPDRHRLAAKVPGTADNLRSRRGGVESLHRQPRHDVGRDAGALPVKERRRCAGLRPKTIPLERREKA